MKTEIEFVDIARENELEGQINREISKLNTRYIWLMHAIVYLKLDKGFGRDHVVETEIRMPGNPIFVKEKANNFRLAITKAFSVVHRQLEKRKELLYQH